MIWLKLHPKFIKVLVRLDLHPTWTRLQPNLCSNWAHTFRLKPNPYWNPKMSNQSCGFCWVWSVGSGIAWFKSFFLVTCYVGYWKRSNVHWLLYSIRVKYCMWYCDDRHTRPPFSWKRFITWASLSCILIIRSAAQIRNHRLQFYRLKLSRKAYDWAEVHYLSSLRGDK